MILETVFGRIQCKNLNINKLKLGLLKSFQKSNLPSSISIMLNFGTSERHLLYDASSEEHGCGAVQVWDPFIQVLVHISALNELLRSFHNQMGVVGQCPKLRYFSNVTT